MGKISRKWLGIILIALVIASVLSVSGLGIFVTENRSIPNSLVSVGIGQKVFTIAAYNSPAEAAVTADFTCDGLADNIQFQQAMNALPDIGGKLEVLAGTYNFVATVYRLIDNITIEGVGAATYFANNNGVAIFNASSQSNWVFRDFSTDGGGINYGSSTNYILENITIGGTFYSFVTSGTFTGVTGRGATVVVAASDATTTEKAQADYVCVGVEDDITINDAIDDIEAAGGGILQLTGRTFYIALTSATNNLNKISLPSHTIFDLGGSTLKIASADLAGGGGHYNYQIVGAASGAVNVTIRNGTIDGNQAVIDPTGNDAQEYLITDADATSRDVKIDNMRLINATRQAILPRGYSWQINDLYTAGNLTSDIIAQGIHGLNINNWISESQPYAIFQVESVNPGDNTDININNWFVNDPIGRILNVGGTNQDLDGLNVSNVTVRDCGLYGLIQNSLALNCNFNNIVITKKTAVNTTCMSVYNARVNNATLIGYIGIGGTNNEITNSNINATYNVALVNSKLVNCRLQLVGYTVLSSSAVKFIGCTFLPDFQTSYYKESGTNSNISFTDSVNYIGQGETRIFSGSLTAGNANAICFAWNNPYSTGGYQALAPDLLVKKVTIEVTTAGGTGGSLLQVGIADDATGTNLGSEFFTAVTLNTPAVYDSYLVGDTGAQTKWVLCKDAFSATDDWIVGKITVQNAASLVGKYYVELVGR